MIAALILQTASPDAAPHRDVVVVGERPEDALARCRARRCSVAEDAAAALALARQQFVAGDYRAAHRTLVAATDRHRGDARTDPLPVAALWRNKAKLELHLGEAALFRSSVLQQYQVLRAGLPADDPQRLAGLIEIGDMLVQTRNGEGADAFYRDALAGGERAGRPQVAGPARLRLATLVLVRARGKPDAADERAAAAWVGPVIASTDPGYARYDFPARLLLARLAEQRGAAGRIDAALRAPRKDAGGKPVLVAADPIRLPELVKDDCAETFARASTDVGAGKSVASLCGNPQNGKGRDDVERQWIDVSFQIGDDGGVGDAAVLRHSDTYAGGWADAVLRAVGSRRYAVAAGAPTGGRTRVERFTLTAPYQLVTGERVRSRELNPVVETEDLTPDLAPRPVG